METTNRTSENALFSREKVLIEITQIIAEQMDQKPEEIGENDHLINDVGCDSLDITEIVMMIEEHYDIHVPDEDVESARTPGQVADGVVRLLHKIRP